MHSPRLFLRISSRAGSGAKSCERRRFLFRWRRCGQAPRGQPRTPRALAAEIHGFRIEADRFSGHEPVGGMTEDTPSLLACISHHPTVKARDTPAMTSLRLLAVLDVLSSTPARAKRRAPRPDGPLTHFASPRDEKCRLEAVGDLNVRDDPRGLLPRARTARRLNDGRPSRGMQSEARLAVPTVRSESRI